MNKDFDNWNQVKKLIENEDKKVYGYPREVWWCSFGINIGAEIDGKNENYERTVVILFVYNKESMLVLPITSKPKPDKFHYKITIQTKKSGTSEIIMKDVWVKLTQARVISNKRLIRKVDVIPEVEFKNIQDAFRKFT